MSIYVSVVCELVVRCAEIGYDKAKAARDRAYRSGRSQQPARGDGSSDISRARNSMS